MTKLTVFSNKGAKLAEVEPAFTKSEVNVAALAQAIRVYTHNAHLGLARVKTRGEVKISTRKIYRQKGTGNARHGAKSAPIFVGGGIAHGPKGLKRSVALSKAIKDIALRSALATKAKEKSLVLVDGLSKFSKTSDVASFINKVLKELGTKETARVTFVLPTGEKPSAFRNLRNALVYGVNSLNALTVMNGGLVFIDADAASYFDNDKKPVTKESQSKKTIQKKTTVKETKSKDSKKVTKGGKQ